ncbi:hypothetical protein [Chryseobacterium indoltheticum]|uniref:hypothetical protein n=1 Tax=Chryseobacterium indoltheticum TaxID=254 RepID=UPI003F497A69
MFLRDENLNVKVETKNYNEQNLKKSYQVKLSKLESPNRIFRDNFKTEVQNLPKFSKEEFISKFPHDLYDKNDEIKNWKVEKVIIDRIENQESRIKNSNLENKDKSLESSVLNLKFFKRRRLPIRIV